MQKIISKPFYFRPHDETDWNKDNIIMGSKDIPLNILGRCQAEEAYKIEKTGSLDYGLC